MTEFVKMKEVTRFFGLRLRMTKPLIHNGFLGISSGKNLKLKLNATD